MLVIKGPLFIYTSDGKTKKGEPPEKCYHCNELLNVNDSCNMERCKVKK